MTRRTQRLRVFLLSCMLAGISCNVAGPVWPVGEPPVGGLLLGEVSPRLRRAETASIERRLRGRVTGLHGWQAERLARVIVGEALAVGLSPSLVMAVIEVESGARNFSTSPVGARGLMQLLPETGASVAASLGAAWGGPDTLFDPALNVRLGVRYLRTLIDRYDDLPTALAAYNWGPARIADRMRRGAPIPRAYAERVLARYQYASRDL